MSSIASVIGRGLWLHHFLVKVVGLQYLYHLLGIGKEHVIRKLLLDIAKTKFEMSKSLGWSHFFRVADMPKLTGH